MYRLCVHCQIAKITFVCALIWREFWILLSFLYMGLSFLGTNSLGHTVILLVSLEFFSTLLLPNYLFGNMCYYNALLYWITC
jgi:hypothetical protein